MNFSQITIHFMIFFFQIEKKSTFLSTKLLILISRVLFFNRLFIYVYNTSSYQFNSLYEAPLPKFGFHPCRVYRFSLFFSKDIVSVALYDLSTMPDGLGLRSVVSKMLPAFIRCSTNTTIIADCGCPDFPLFLAIGSHEHAYFTQNRKKKQSLFIFIDFFF